MAEPQWSTGMFVWRELMTGDVDAARRFYGELFRWTWKGEDMGPGGMYWLASLGDEQIAGAMKKPMESMPSAWSSYVLVDDVDAAAQRGQSAGARVLKEPTDIPEVGRFAVLADPWGAVLLPFHAKARARPLPRMGPGKFCWETLVTADPAGAIAFYRKVAGFGTARRPVGTGRCSPPRPAPRRRTCSARAPGLRRTGRPTSPSSARRLRASSRCGWGGRCSSRASTSRRSGPSPSWRIRPARRWGCSSQGSARRPGPRRAPTARGRPRARAGARAARARSPRAPPSPTRARSRGGRWPGHARCSARRGAPSLPDRRSPR